MEEIKEKELTEKNKLFCTYYLSGFGETKAYNQTQSYLKVYDCSYETAMANSSKLLSDDRIVKYIKNIEPNIDLKRKENDSLLIKNNLGYIYIIQCENFHYYKIGKSKNGGSNRIKKMQTGMPFDLKLIEDVKVDEFHDFELELHRIYKEQRIRGEWFLFTDNQLFGLRNRLKNMEFKDE